LLHELPDTDWQLAKSFRDTEASGGDGAAALFGRETLQLTRKTRNLSTATGARALDRKSPVNQPKLERGRSLSPTCGYERPRRSSFAPQAFLRPAVWIHILSRSSNLYCFLPSLESQLYPVF
jgi:hypothetical protein